MDITFLGTGTSVGIPMIGCGCVTCTSEDPRDRRSRSSIFVRTDEASWVVDTGPDFREQCLREGITSMDAVLYTHGHMDHVVGFDELRRFTLGADATLPLYAREETMNSLRRMFDYAFNGENRYPGYFKPDPKLVVGPFQVGKTEVVPLQVSHGKVDTVGFLFVRGDRRLLAYIPDCKTLSAEALKSIEGVETLVIDALRYTAHPTHMNFEEALALVGSLDVGQTYFTHFSCEVRHAEAEKGLPTGVALTYDGLRISIG